MMLMKRDGPSDNWVECPVLLYRMNDKGQMELWDAFPTWEEGDIAYDAAQAEEPGREFDLATLST